MSPPSYRGEGQPTLAEGRFVGLAWSEAPPEYRGQEAPSHASPSGGLLAGLQRLLGVAEAPAVPAYRQEGSAARESPRARRITKNERPKARQKPPTNE